MNFKDDSPETRPVSDFSPTADVVYPLKPISPMTLAFPAALLTILSAISLANGLWIATTPPSPIPPGMEDNSAYMAGRALADIASSRQSIAHCAIALIGGVLMLFRRAHSLASLCAVVALIPIPPQVCLMMPVGIWCLTSLTKHGVQQTFK